MFKRSFLILIVLQFMMLSKCWSAPKVVVSIAPVHSLVANVMKGIGSPDLLVTGSQSPHHFSLTPSQVQKIKDADLVIWIGDALETFLVKPIQSFGTHSCPLIDAPNLQILSLRGEPCGGACKHKGLIDPHVWLDINNAIAMVDQIVVCLGQIDPTNHTQYEQNAAKLKEGLMQLKQEIEQQAQGFKGLKFICLHDAFHYYEKMVGVTNVGVLASTHSLEPSLKHLGDLKELLKQGSVTCAFSEPQSQSKVLNNLAQEFNLYNGIIDPLGADIEPGIDQYFLLLHKITNAFTDCQKSRHD
jgi:zinc transport system substrate-binding protein